MNINKNLFVNTGLGLSLGYNDEDSVRDGYPSFEAHVKHFFEKAIAGGKKLFMTNPNEDLFELFLANIPANARQHYTCNACRHFINRFGGLVTLNEDGTMNSAIWDPANTPKFFVKAVAAIRDEVLAAQVTSIFIPESRKLGTPKTGEWTHLHVEVPRQMINSSRVHTAHQVMAEKREEFGMVHRALQDFSIDTVQEALQLIDAEVLYRGDKAKGNIVWFKELMEKRNATRLSNRKRNVVWLAVANAPAGFTHIRSSAAGTLLKNIEAGLSVTEIAEEFRKIMDPSNYMRSQTGPSTAAIYEAEKTVAKLGLETALQRRYAKFEEVPLAWKPKNAIEKVLANKQAGVFSHLTAVSKPATSMNIPAKLMTWEKFQNTVLPTAESIEVLIDNPARFMALVTAADPNAENILQWDNPFSWYYHGGVDAEMQRRLEQFGGRYEDNEIRVSLMWDGLTDLDLHCKNPRGQHLYYSQKRDSYGGYLDLDMNGLDKNSDKPVENMRWASNAPEGRYQFYVHNYNEKVNGRLGTPFKAELEINGKVYHFEGQPLTDSQKTVVFEFDYKRGQDPVFRTRTHSTSAVEAWGVEQNSFVKVKGITTSPNLWGNRPVTQNGTHIFFLLEGAKDESEGLGRGFFNEMLKQELRPIRRTLELFTAQTPIEDAEEATACGVGYSKDNPWDLTLKVTSGNTARMIKIDRWD